MDFSNKVLWVVNLFGLEVWVTETMLSTWIIMAILIIAAVILRIGLRKLENQPGKLQNAVEAVVETFDGIIRNTAGEEFEYLGSWFFMVFLFILTSNISGIFGLRPPTADWSVTIALAMVTFVLIQASGIVNRKWGYFKSFFQPIFIFFPLNIIGELSKPVSLSFRLFGNVLAGMILMSLVYSLPIYLRFVIPAALNVYFDLFTGAIQTYIFCVLSLTFISGAATE